MKIEWKYISRGDIALLVNDINWAEIITLDSGKFSWFIDVNQNTWYGQSLTVSEAQQSIIRILTDAQLLK